MKFFNCLIKEKKLQVKSILLHTKKIWNILTAEWEKNIFKCVLFASLMIKLEIANNKAFLFFLVHPKINAISKSMNELL